MSPLPINGDNLPERSVSSLQEHVFMNKTESDSSKFTVVVNTVRVGTGQKFIHRHARCLHIDTDNSRYTTSTP